MDGGSGGYELTFGPRGLQPPWWSVKHPREECISDFPQFIALPVESPVPLPLQRMHLSKPGGLWSFSNSAAQRTSVPVVQQQQD